MLRTRNFQCRSQIKFRSEFVWEARRRTTFWAHMQATELQMGPCTILRTCEVTTSVRSEFSVAKSRHGNLEQSSDTDHPAPFQAETTTTKAEVYNKFLSEGCQLTYPQRRHRDLQRDVCLRRSSLTSRAHTRRRSFAAS